MLVRFPVVHTRPLDAIMVASTRDGFFGTANSRTKVPVPGENGLQYAADPTHSPGTDADVTGVEPTSNLRCSAACSRSKSAPPDQP
jgi:hypothetical protein